MTELPSPPPPGDDWCRLRDRLRELELDAPGALPGAEALMELPESLRSLWLPAAARSETHAAAAAYRLFILGDALPESAVTLALGPALAEQARASRLIVPAPGGWSCPFLLEAVNGLFVLSDRQRFEPQSVMAIGPTTRVLACASFPQQDIGRALDLGCGSGILALLIAGAAERVVATDVNPRALALGRFNASLNGIRNIEFRAGALFDPVREDRFDLIVCQPPCCPLPPAETPVAYLHGGPRGDELARAIVAEAPGHLSPGGLAFVLTDLPLRDGESPLADFRASQVDPAVDMLLLTSHPAVAPRTYTASYYANRLEHAGLAAWTALRAARRHHETLGITALRSGLAVILAPGPDRIGNDGFTVELHCTHERWDTLQRRQIDRAVALLRRRAAQTDWPSRVSLSPSAFLRTERSAASGDAGTTVIDSTDGLPLGPLPVSPSDLEWLSPRTSTHPGELRTRESGEPTSREEFIWSALLAGVLEPVD